jgi:hypothetical protein
MCRGITGCRTMSGSSSRSSFPDDFGCARNHGIVVLILCRLLEHADQTGHGMQTFICPCIIYEEVRVSSWAQAVELYDFPLQLEYCDARSIEIDTVPLLGSLESENDVGCHAQDMMIDGGKEGVCD